ncbi:retropepsin-like aspartic protease [Maricaulis salignorans]|uniref:Aspartyl protease n=1 Tax=Maricaulis salignorans TaxID=144026 RepID=A0A1G9P5F2_9PROT|nr:retropepsin-like aspartic protease [Maricaulis salignorans]SDL93949.1 Aspartyl protease [Maricaulis salignorans]
MRNFVHFVPLALLLAGLSPAQTQETDLARLLSAPLRIERSESVTTVNLETRGGKLFIHAVANGEAGEFILDSGSPTILSRDFADALGLETVAQNTGRDANGTEVTMDFAILRTLQLGTTVFHDIPVLIHDFSTLDMGACLVGPGILGSELFPGSVWRFDTRAAELSIATSLNELPELAPVASTRLYDFGYPHAPIIDYSVGDVSDKALFDTGSSAEVALFSQVAQAPSVRQAVRAGSRVTGTGYEGESAGGRGEVTTLTRFTLSDFRLDGGHLAPVRATVRAVPPTLVGAGILASHAVTLDYPGGQFIVQARNGAAPAHPEPGYSLALVGNDFRVVQLFEESTAAHAGLRLGDQVTELSGRSLVVSADNPKCTVANWLFANFDPAEATELVILRDGVSSRLSIPQH